MEEQLVEQAQHALDSICASGAVPGISLSFWVGGSVRTVCAGVEMAGRSDPVIPQTRFRAGCIAKIWIALLALELAAEGALDLDAGVDEYLPDLKAPEDGKAAPTIRNLLSHSGGYREPENDRLRWSMTWDLFAEFFVRRDQAFRPGTVWSYSQTGHALVALAIERVLGRPAIAEVQDRLLGPLGLDVQGASGGGSAAGVHLWSERTNRFEPLRLPRDAGILAHSITELSVTSSDLCLLADAMMDGGSTDQALVSAGTRALLLSAGLPIDYCWRSQSGEQFPVAYGVGMGDMGGFHGHTGSFVGCTSAVLFDPQPKLAVAVCLNAWQAKLRDRLCHGIMRGLRKTLLEAEPGLPPPAAVAEDVTVEAWAGRYLPLMFSLKPLTLEPDGSISSPLWPNQRPRIGQGPDGTLAAQAGADVLPSFHLFRNEADGRPALRLGYSVYVREDASGP